MFRLALLSLLAALCPAQPGPAYHLTARPWQPLDIAPARYLDAIEGVCRYTARLQNNDGAIIDPFIHVEHQYATPYFAYAIGTLAEEHRAADLLPNGIRAMEHATRSFAQGRDAIPEQHGEFFIAVLTGALPLYEHHAPRQQWLTWRERMKTPSDKVIKRVRNNWETYVMKGDWMRAQAGLIPRAAAVDFIERVWAENHSKRIAPAPWFLYHDRTSDPDTLNVEAVGRGNMLAMIAAGYDGPSAAAIARIVEQSTRNTMLLQDPTGQVPPNGRTDNHVWVEIGYQLALEVMAERAWKQGDRDLAGQFRRAAMLAFQSAQRWRRIDDAWAGSYYVTKNRFDPALRVGYQPASQYTNYNGSLMFHLAEAFHTRRTAIPERPTPSEIGGYAFQLDDEFSAAFANAGGLHLQANLRGQTSETHANFWTPLGIVRVSRPGWDSRLGPGDGAFDGKRGVTFAPEFDENGTWLRMADLPHRYVAKWNTKFTHPALVRCSLTYEPRPGQSGPSFHQKLTITPAGVLSEVRRLSGSNAFGVTWPVLESDGAPLHPNYALRHATTGYNARSDEQTFLALDPGSKLDRTEPVIRGTFGDIRPVRATSPGDVQRTFIYPRTAADPTAASVLAAWKATPHGFVSPIGRLENNVWIGPTSAGGVASELDIDGDGKPEASFSKSCGFLAQLTSGVITAIETDSAVSVTIGRRTIRTQPATPVPITASPASAR